MFAKKTNLEEIKNVAKMFLMLPINDTEYYPLVVSHPFFNSAFISLKKQDGSDSEIVDITSIDGYRRAIKQISNTIENICDPVICFHLIRTPYHLTFLKYIKKYTTKEDFSKWFGNAWVQTENPNQDSNVPVRQSASWFNQSDKSLLMQEDEYEYFCKLPETITLYRGVAIGRNPNGLSWTANKKKAEWFAHRFDAEDKGGYIKLIQVNKSDVLAYFSRRGEEEYVVYQK